MAIERVYLVKARTILAAIWRKKMEAIKDRERTMTTNGSLLVSPYHQDGQSCAKSGVWRSTRGSAESSSGGDTQGVERTRQIRPGDEATEFVHQLTNWSRMVCWAWNMVDGGELDAHFQTGFP
jgi:hypothetical protein